MPPTCELKCAAPCVILSGVFPMGHPDAEMRRNATQSKFCETQQSGVEQNRKHRPDISRSRDVILEQASSFEILRCARE